MSTFFSATPGPNCPSPNINALPQAGVIDPAFIPCLATFQGFVLNGTSTPTNDTTQTAAYWCSGPGIPSNALFGLVVPRKVVAPNTQQWIVTFLREFGENWVLELGYVGAHSLPQLETR